LTTLYIAEKPSVASNLARALNCKRHDGYFEGNGNIVTFAFGHLLTLKDSVDYDPEMKYWSLDKFPFIPKKYEYKVNINRKTKKTDSGAKKQLGIIKKLSQRSDITKVVNACDLDREGSLIFKVITDYIKVDKPMYRMSLNEWTPNEIKKAVRNLSDNSKDLPRQIAGECRQHADWEIGINFTSTATLKYIQGRGKKPLSIGRVVLPTLKLIYDRDMEIKNFVPQDYFELRALFNSGNGQYEGFLLNKDNKLRFDDKNKLKNIEKEILGNSGSIYDKQIKFSKKYAPRLFNLNDLEGYITSKYSGWTSDKVDKIVQVLYEGKGEGGYISYPRTKSRHLEDTQDVKNKTKKVFEVLTNNHKLKDGFTFHTNKNVFDSKKVDSHGAIVPTYVVPNNLSRDEELVYKAVVNRFLSQFMPPAEYENTTILTKVGNYLFQTKGKVLINKGWLALYGKDPKDNLLPKVSKGDSVVVAESECLSKQTQPPNHYTEKTLFKAMENCGKKYKDDGSDDEEMLTSILSGFEIGTPATRSDTVKKMKYIGYIKTSGKSLVVTNKGIKLIEVFPVSQLMDLEFTGKLEKTLSDIEKGIYSKDKFMKLIDKLTISGVKRIKESKGTVEVGESKGSSNTANKKSIGKCPKCGKDIIEGKKGYGCSGWRDGCNVVIWKKNAFLEKFNIKKVSISMAENLLKNEEVVFKADYSNIKAKLVEKEGKYSLEFDVEQRETASIGVCPSCGKNVLENSKAYTCEDKNCDFVLFKDDKFLKKFKKKLNKKMVKELLKDNKTHVDKMYSSKKDKYFEADLSLIKNGKYWNYKFNF